MQEIINKELIVTVPEGFEVLSAEALNNLYLDNNPNRWGMADKERHLTGTIFYHVSNILLSAIANAKDVANSTRIQLSKRLSEYDYIQGDSFEVKICSLDAYGFHYEYTNHHILTNGIVAVFKRGRACYTVYWYSRKESDINSDSIFNEFCESLSFSK